MFFKYTVHTNIEINAVMNYPCAEIHVYLMFTEDVHYQVLSTEILMSNIKYMVWSL